MKLPEIPDDDSDFTPELARKIIAKYQALLSHRGANVAGEAVAWRWQAANGVWHLEKEDVGDCEPLYAHPAPAGRDPATITDDQVDAAWRECSFPVYDDVKTTVRAAFAAGYRLSHFAGRDPATFGACIEEIRKASVTSGLNREGVAALNYAISRVRALADPQPIAGPGPEEYDPATIEAAAAIAESKFYCGEAAHAGRQIASAIRALAPAVVTEEH